MTSYSFLGATTGAIGYHGLTGMAGLSAKLQGALIGAVDSGRVGIKGQPVLFSSDGSALGNSGARYSDADPSQGLPGANALGSAVSDALGKFGVFGSESFWKGLGLMLAGVLLLIFAALEIKNMTVGSIR